MKTPAQRQADRQKRLNQAEAELKAWMHRINLCQGLIKEIHDFEFFEDEIKSKLSFLEYLIVPDIKGQFLDDFPVSSRILLQLRSRVLAEQR